MRPGEVAKAFTITRETLDARDLWAQIDALDGKVPESVEQRLKDYHRETTALQIYFPNAVITEIDGTKKPRTVTKNIEAVLKANFVK